MANSALLSDGTTSYEFVYDSASQDDFKLRYGMSVAAGEPNVLWHRPDNAPPQLVRITNDLTTIFLTTIVYGDDWDDVINTLAPIKRWVDGDDQQAARYHNSGDVNKIYARIQLDGMTNYTDWTVIYGNVDDSKSYYTVVADRNKLAVDVVLMLTCEPVGNGASFTLRNDLASSPHWVEDSNSDGLADGWSLISTPTVVSDTTNYLTGGVSGRCTTTASGSEGVRTDTVTAASSSDVVAYVWTSLNVNGDNVTAFLFDGSGAVVQQKSFDYTTIAATADKTAVDSAGRTWYRIVLSGTLANANVFLRISRENADSTQTTRFYIDNAYLHVGSTTAPDGWCSTSAIQNRYDPTASAEGRINYFDTWGIPGDVPALIDTSLVCTTVTGVKDVVMAGRVTDGLVDANSVLHWVDDADMDWLILSGTQSNPSDATRSAGEYIRHTADASSVDQATLRIDIGTAFSNLVDFLTIPHRVFLITRSSSVATTYEMQVGLDYIFLTGGAKEVTPNAANTWELLDLGYLNSLEKSIGDYGQTTGGGTLSVHVVPGATSATVDVDACLLMPASSSGWCVISGTSIAASSSYVTQFIGTLGVTLGGRDTSLPGWYGELWTLPQGNKMSRFVFAYTTASSNVHHLTDAATVTMTVTPRTRHLLGTL